MSDESALNSESAKLAHLGFIQSAISRMAGHAFAVKALVVTITGAGLGLFLTDTAPDARTALLGVIPVTVLWSLDAKYLVLEKRFRALYDAVVDGTETRPMHMNPNSYKEDTIGFWTAARTWSVLWLYLVALVTFVGLAGSDCITGWMND